MKFETSHGIGEVVIYIAEVLVDHLIAGERVFWLLSGGSCIEVAVAVGQQLMARKINVAKLTVTLIDERFGSVGHADSNWTQLLDGGFKLPGARFLPVLEGKTMAETATAYNNVLRRELAAADYSLGLLGMGADGHTSGLLPGSPPAIEAAHLNDNLDKQLATAYNWTDYRRITTTAAALTRFNEAVLYASGEAKWPMLRRLKDPISIAEMPVQLLKQVKLLTIFTDYQETTQ